MQFLKDLIDSISLANLVDIGIIACLLYFVLTWIQATRAFQILASMIAIGLFYFVASKLGLILTSLLFQYLWAAIIIVLVILFQPEIRDILDRASPIRYLSGRRPNDMNPDLIEEMVKAVSELARLRIGALIVFRRMDRLDNLILKGKLLDSLLSAETLVMIFQKHSPIHDGAVLIYNERIKAAGCILPLSRDEALSVHYGTRHRAALGLTERTDAFLRRGFRRAGRSFPGGRKDNPYVQEERRLSRGIGRGSCPRQDYPGGWGARPADLSEIQLAPEDLGNGDRGSALVRDYWSSALGGGDVCPHSVHQPSCRNGDNRYVDGSDRCTSTRFGIGTGKSQARLHKGGGGPEYGSDGTEFFPDNREEPLGSAGYDNLSD